MSISAQDVQNVIAVQDILADHDVTDAKPELIVALIDWKQGDKPAPTPAPAPVPAAPTSNPKTAKTTGKQEVPDDEPAF